MSKLLLGTNNSAKVREYKTLLQNLPFELVTLAEQGITTIVDEIGESLEENARIKAEALAEQSQLLTLADDSGLEVDALGGEPGQLSARYAGEGASDKDRINYLLSRLKEVPWPERSARNTKRVAADRSPAKQRAGSCTRSTHFGTHLAKRQK